MVKKISQAEDVAYDIFMVIVSFLCSIYFLMFYGLMQHIVNWGISKTLSILKTEKIKQLLSNENSSSEYKIFNLRLIFLI